ncbi:MAG: hypothetical protein GY701_31915 [Sulfitobacter sp.]|nr:hypothetical protein [Sulfitobacter sp.]
MLVIRTAQMEIFQLAAQYSFETRMVEHSFGFQPRLCKTLGAERVRAVVHDGISHAADYGFTNRGPARLYLEMMLLFGSGYVTDPQYPWAAEILASGGVEDQMQRAAELHEKTLVYQDRVAGPDNAHTLSALAQLPLFARNPLPFSFDDFVPGMLREMGDIYPQKVEYIGHEAIGQLINEAMEVARSFQLLTVRGVALTAVLMFAFGHGCCNDPLYPWIARTLTDPSITDEIARADRLEWKALTWLDHVHGRKKQART